MARKPAYLPFIRAALSEQAVARSEEVRIAATWSIHQSAAVVDTADAAFQLVSHSPQRDLF